MRDRDLLSHLPQNLKMFGNSLAEGYRHFFDRCAGSNTPWDIRRVRGKSLCGVSITMVNSVIVVSFRVQPV